MNITDRQSKDNEPLGQGIQLAQAFEEATWIHDASSLQASYIPHSWTSINRKQYPRLPRVDLSGLRSPSQNSELSKVFEHRSSKRQFLPEPIALETLSTMLATVASTRNEEPPSRVYPSAGLRWPIEWYLAAINVASLEAGVYHYESFDHQLETLKIGNPWNELAEALSMQSIDRPSALLILTSVFHRSWIKYGIRGSRYAYLEAGAAAMSLNIVAVEANIGVVWLGGFVDSSISKILDINWKMELETPVLCLALGHPI